MTIPPPAGWALDNLSDYLESAHRNRFATFVNKQSEVAQLIALDACFAGLFQNWKDPENLVAPLLALRSHSAFRVGCENAMAGQVTESFTQARSCLEYAGYALRIADDASMAEIWLRCHDDGATLRKAKDAFKIAEVKRVITSHSESTAKIFDELYQRAIDTGAHPNERAISSSALITRVKGCKTSTRFTFIRMMVIHSLTACGTWHKRDCALWTSLSLRFQTDVA